jgi:hypothetical protein
VGWAVQTARSCLARWEGDVSRIFKFVNRLALNLAYLINYRWRISIPPLYLNIPPQKYG